jgi:hypothetical protein
MKLLACCKCLGARLSNGGTEISPRHTTRLGATSGTCTAIKRHGSKTMNKTRKPIVRVPRELSEVFYALLPSERVQARASIELDSSKYKRFSKSALIGGLALKLLLEEAERRSTGASGKLKGAFLKPASSGCRRNAAKKV